MEEQKNKVESGLLEQQNFMALGMSNMTQRATNNEVAASVPGHLQPKPSLIPTLNVNLAKLMDRGSEVQTFFLDSQDCGGILNIPASDLWNSRDHP